MHGCDVAIYATEGWTSRQAILKEMLKLQYMGCNALLASVLYGRTISVGEMNSVWWTQQICTIYALERVVSFRHCNTPEELGKFCLLLLEHLEKPQKGCAREYGV